MHISHPYQVTIGGMKFNTIQQRGIKCKELGPNMVVSNAASQSTIVITVACVAIMESDGNRM